MKDDASLDEVSSQSEEEELDGVDPKVLEAQQEARRKAKEEKKAKAEADKKEKRKAKKLAKEKGKDATNTKGGSALKGGVSNKKEQSLPGKESGKKEASKETEINKESVHSEEISEKKGDVIVVEHRDEKNTSMRVGKDLIVISNAEFDKLEEIRKKRELDAKEKEAEKKKIDAMKEESRIEYEKLQEKLALKNQMKNKKTKKH